MIPFFFSRSKLTIGRNKRMVPKKRDAGMIGIAYGHQYGQDTEQKMNGMALFHGKGKPVTAGCRGGNKAGRALPAFKQHAKEKIPGRNRFFCRRRFDCRQ